MSEQKAILESIRDIIASPEDASADDNVLVLTQKVNSDGSITKLELVTPPQAAAKPPIEAAPAESTPEESDDILGELDALLSEPPKPEPEPITAPAMEIRQREEPLPSPAAIVEPEPVIPPESPIQAAPPPAPEPEPAATAAPEPEPEISVENSTEINNIETNIELELTEVIEQTQSAPILRDDQMEEIVSLLSEKSADAAKSSISSLMEKVREANEPKTEPGGAFRSGETVENLVMEMLKPMLREWIDKNLPQIVESAVQKEIQKITSI